MRILGARASRPHVRRMRTIPMINCFAPGFRASGCHAVRSDASLRIENGNAEHVPSRGEILRRRAAQDDSQAQGGAAQENAYALIRHNGYRPPAENMLQ